METDELDGVVAIISGGLDSTVMLWQLAKNGHNVVEALSFDYGQRHRKELEHVKKIVSRYSEQFGNLDHKIVDVSNINQLISKGSLTGGEDLPKEMYNEPSQRITVVPNRNMIFIAISAGRAVTLDASHVAYAAHASDHEVYPDCRPDFIKALDKALYLGNLWDPVRLYAPFQEYTKGDVITQGIKDETPLELTWSCYSGQSRPCLECGTCLERTEAFMSNSISDPSLSTEEWQRAVRLYQEHKDE